VRLAVRTFEDSVRACVSFGGIICRANLQALPAIAQLFVKGNIPAGSLVGGFSFLSHAVEGWATCLAANGTSTTDPEITGE
jgi:hypothetical protein